MLIEKERRNEENNRVVSLAIATRAAQKRLSADQMFEQHEDLAENKIRLEDFTDSNLRSKVEALLLTLEYFDALVDTQYPNSIQTLKVFNLYNPEQLKEGDVLAPTIEEAKKILATQITTEQLEVIKKMEKPILQLIPITSIDRYVKAFNSYKPMKTQVDADMSFCYSFISEKADERDNVINNAIIDWRIALTEGTKEPKLLEGENDNSIILEKVKWFTREFGRKGVTGVDLKRMLILMMWSLKEENPVNHYGGGTNRTKTILNEEPRLYNTFFYMAWNSDSSRAKIGGPSVWNHFPGMRFRVSVMVDA